MASTCGLPVIWSGTHWKRYSTVVSYYCVAPGGKETSSVNHGGAKYSCFQFLTTKDYISSLRED